MPAPGLPFDDRPLPYAPRLARRDAGDIRLLVIHCTELPDLATAREFGERVLYAASGTGNSGHWYIDRDGHCERWVEETRIAHHVRGCNAHSIGIELVNTGRWPDWLDSRRQAMAEPYPAPQIAALLRLLADLRRRFPSLQQIAGHEDLDREDVAASDDPAVRVRRKRDPGPHFPWPQVLAACGLERIGTPPDPA
ncbi:N-acetylmuramoyl-L-alanine amidase [Luteimonas sp. e5]